jgi:hypothetical protein
MSAGFVVFDIETGPQPMERLRAVLPGWDPSSLRQPGKFDPKEVKTGNLKDAEKIASKIESARAEHEAAVANFETAKANAEAAYWREAAEKAALSSTTGQVLAIGIKSESETELSCIDLMNDEVAMLTWFWKTYQCLRSQGRNICGFHSKEFDIPFLAQRSVILGVPVPKTLIQNERYLDPIFIDLRDRWSFGSRASGSLDLICRACGIGGKPDGIDGSMFHTLYADEATRPSAIAYLKNDLEMTYEMAVRLLA